jgi:hypothetical protein
MPLFGWPEERWLTSCIHGAVYRREQAAYIWMLTDHRTRRTAKKLGHSPGRLSRRQDHIIHTHRCNVAVSISPSNPAA